MLFKINEKEGSLERAGSDWNPKELELERYLVTKQEGVDVLFDSVFGEPLLLVSNQVKTSAKKRADILALDRAGNGVIIELKRQVGQLGIETQALQYLADFSKYRGEAFLQKFSHLSKDTVMSFMGEKADLNNLNQRSRVILVARSFDETVFSLGEWLTSKGVAFRCIRYLPIEIGKEQLLSFSVAFDRSLDAIYSLTFNTNVRQPGIFWHNIANANQDWWSFLVSSGQIPACFEDSPGDQGERVLRKYISGDIVVAYAAGYGAVGWGKVESPDTYKLIPIGDKDDRMGGVCRHRIRVKWHAIATKLEQSMPAEQVRKDYAIYHPISTSVSIDPIDGKKLIEALSLRFKS
jgi:hypothetical protein